jgi:hypothetical protein
MAPYTQRWRAALNRLHHDGGAPAAG